MALLNKEQLIEKYGSFSEAARKLNLPRGTLKNRLRHGPVEDEPQVKVGKSLDDFRNTFDKATIIPAKIKKALEKMGPNNWMYESEFAKLAEVNLHDLGNFREEFAAYVVTIGRDSKRAWGGSPATAQKMREML